MALLPQNPRDQKLVLVALVAVGLAATYQQLVWKPKNADLQTLSARLDTLDSLNRIAQADVRRGNAAKMKQEADEFARQLAVLRRLVPTQNEVPALVESISSAARRAGLEFSDVQPDGIVSGDQFDTYRYKVAVTGPYHQVAEFVSNIGSLPRIVVPMNMQLQPTNRAGGELKPRKNEQLLDVHFQVQTYVAHASSTDSTSQLPVSTGKPGAP
jgi:type IV pilus assembly protein PilO